jgi:hypothetical protein
MKRLSVILCAVMISCFVLAAPGLSQDQDKTLILKEGKGACKADIEKFCKDIKPGGGRVWVCLKSNGDRLSQECANYMALAREKSREKSRDFRQACKGDAEKFCKGIATGKGRIVSCLKSHEAELSDACAAIFRR